MPVPAVFHQNRVEHRRGHPSPNSWQRFPHPGRPSLHPCHSSPASVARRHTFGTARSTSGTSCPTWDARDLPREPVATLRSAVATPLGTTALFCSPLPRSQRGAPGSRHGVLASRERTPVSALRRHTRLDARPPRGNVGPRRATSPQPSGGPCPPPERAFQRSCEALQSLVGDRPTSGDLSQHTGPKDEKLTIAARRDTFCCQRYSMPRAPNGLKWTEKSRISTCSVL